MAENLEGKKKPGNLAQNLTCKCIRTVNWNSFCHFLGYLFIEISLILYLIYFISHCRIVANYWCRDKLFAVFNEPPWKFPRLTCLWSLSLNRRGFEKQGLGDRHDKRMLVKDLYDAFKLPLLLRKLLLRHKLYSSPCSKIVTARW